MLPKIIEVGMFAEVLDSKLAEYGVKKGDIVYVAGDAIVGVDAKDPYLLRRIFVGAFTKDGHIMVHEKPFTVDGKRLAPVSRAKQEKLTAIKLADFKEENERVEAQEEKEAEVNGSDPAVH